MIRTACERLLSEQTIVHQTNAVVFGTRSKEATSVLKYLNIHYKLIPRSINSSATNLLVGLSKRCESCLTHKPEQRPAVASASS